MALLIRRKPWDDAPIRMIFARGWLRPLPKDALGGRQLPFVRVGAARVVELVAPLADRVAPVQASRRARAVGRCRRGVEPEDLAHLDAVGVGELVERHQVGDAHPRPRRDPRQRVARDDRVRPRCGGRLDVRNLEA